MMSERMTLLFFILIAFASSKPCSKLANDAYNFNYRENEIFEKPLTEFFTDEATSKLTLTPLSDNVQIIGYVEQIKKIVRPDLESVHGAKAKTYFLDRKWKNQFALLEKKGLIWNLHITDQSPINRLPEFTTSIQITNDVDTICFDLVFIGDDIVIDCQNTNDDLLYKYVKGAVDVTLIDTHTKFQNGVTKRILIAGSQTVARGSLYDTLQNQDSIIQVRVKDEYVQSIDSALLAGLLNQPLYKLQLVSFSLLDELIPYIALYDKAGTFVILKYFLTQWTVAYQEALNIPNAFGFDFKRDPQIQTTRIIQPLVYLIVQADKTTVIQNQDNKKTLFELPLVIDNIFNAWISPDNFMISKLNTIYQLVILQSELILRSQQTLDGLWVVPDLSSNQFTTLTSLYTTNQQRLLRVLGKTPGIFNIVQETPACTVKLTLAKLDDYKLALREPGLESIKNVLLGGTESQDYYDNYDGAAIKYTQTVTDRRFQLNFLKNSRIDFTQQPQSSKAIFTQMLALPSLTETYYQVQQLQDLNVIISLCILNSNSNQFMCSQRSKYLETIQLTTQNSYFYIYDNLVRGLIMRNTNEILDFIDADSHPQPTIQVIANVKSFSVSQNYIFVVTDTLTQIYEIQATKLTFLFSTDFGINKIQNIFASPKHNKMLVQGENIIWVGQVEGTSYILGYAFGYNALDRTQIVLFANTFVTIYADVQNNIKIYQYDFQDIYNVKYQFQIPTYDYKIEGQIKVATDLIQNYYIVTQNAIKTSFNTLNFRTGGVSSSTLYQIIMTAIEPTITACDQILYQSDSERLIMIPQQMKVETLFQLPQSEYLSTYQVEVYAQTNDIQKVKINQPISVVQTQDVISLDVINIQINLKDFNSGDKCTDLGSTFYKGEVTHFSASCETCKAGTLAIDNRVQYSKTLDSPKSDIVQAIQLDADNIAILSKNHLSIYKEGFTSQINLVPVSCIGSRILPNRDGSQLFVVCDQGTNQKLLIFGCSKSTCTQYGETGLPDNQKALGFTVLDTFVYLVFDDRILAYMIVNNQAELKSTILTSSLGVTYAQAIGVTTNINQLYLTSAQSILVMEFQNINNVFTEIQRFTIDLNELLKTNNKYIAADTLFIKSPIYKVVKDAYVTLKLVLISSNTAHYGIQLSYNCDVTKCSKAKATEIPYMINQYFDWNAINAQINNNYLGLVYFNIKNGELMQAIYKLPETLTGLPETMIGAVSFNSKISSPVLYNNIQYLLAVKNQNIIQLHSLKDSPKLCVLDQLEKQYVTITGHNDRDTSSTKFILQVTNNNTDITTSSGSLTWLWILLSVVGAGIIGFGLWKLYQCKKSQTHDGGLLS